MRLRNTLPTHIIRFQSAALKLCEKKTELFNSRICNMQSCRQAWVREVIVGVSVLAMILCVFMHSRCRQAINGTKQALDSYESCSSSEHEPSNSSLPTEANLGTRPGHPRDSPAHRSFGSSIFTDIDEHHSLSAIGMGQISPPTKAELDQKMHARAIWDPVSSDFHPWTASREPVGHLDIVSRLHPIEC